MYLKIPLILVIGNLKSAFLAIKSDKKANLSLSVLLNQDYLQSSESSNPPEAISLLTYAVGDPESSLFRFFGQKSVKKANFPPFESLNQAYILSSELSNPPKTIPLLTCTFEGSKSSLFHFLVIKLVKKVNFPLPVLWRPRALIIPLF